MEWGENPIRVFITKIFSTKTPVENNSNLRIVIIAVNIQVSSASSGSAFVIPQDRVGNGNSWSNWRIHIRYYSLGHAFLLLEIVCGTVEILKGKLWKSKTRTSCNTAFFSQVRTFYRNKAWGWRAKADQYNVSFPSVPLQNLTALQEQSVHCVQTYQSMSD